MPESTLDDKLAFIQEMSWLKTANNPLPETVLIHIYFVVWLH